MAPSDKVADSLILATVNVGLMVAAFSLVKRYDLLVLPVFMFASPLLLVLTSACLFRDMKGSLRTQAKVALVVSFPVLLFELWFLTHFRLDV